MKKIAVFILNTTGWLMIFIAQLMASVYCVASDSDLYFKLQMRENIAEYAGVSDDDLLALDRRLTAYLFMPMNADAAFDNREIAVFGEMRPPFNERELIHLHDCRRLLSITARPVAYIAFAAAGLALALCGKGKKAASAWIASAAVLLPILAFGIWAVIDFNSAFTFFHRILFTNDLWLLNPETDLLIRICPAAMFASMGLRIALFSALALLGLPLLISLLNLIFKKRKKDTNEIPQI